MWQCNKLWGLGERSREDLINGSCDLKSSGRSEARIERESCFTIDTEVSQVITLTGKCKTYMLTCTETFIPLSLIIFWSTANHNKSFFNHVHAEERKDRSFPGTICTTSKSLGSVYSSSNFGNVGWCYLSHSSLHFSEIFCTVVHKKKRFWHCWVDRCIGNITTERYSCLIHPGKEGNFSTCFLW